MNTTYYEEHAFAPYIRILGKGKNGTRPLTREEAFDAMKMMIEDKVEPEQLGAFMMLMRIKEETREELAGFVEAIKTAFPQDKLTDVDIDWSSYAGKRRHLPWFALSALLLAENGIRIFMHGAFGHTNERIYMKDVLPALGLNAAQSFEEAAEQIKQHNFAYMDLGDVSPQLNRIMNLRPLMGLRSPVHTVARMLNPLNAPYMLQGIFHPGYRPVHQEAALLLNQPYMAVLKGEGGEIERNPDLECLVQSVHNGELSDETWPPLFKQRHVKDENMDLNRLAALWRGEIEDEFAQGTVTGTTAVALRLMGKADSIETAQKMAEEMWANRAKDKYAS